MTRIGIHFLGVENMSTFQLARVPKLRLSSLDDVKAKLGLSKIIDYSEHLTCKDRALALGEQIKKHLLTLDSKIEKLDSVKLGIPEHSLETLRRAVSLQEALNGQGFSLLRTVVERKLSQEGHTETLNIIHEAHKLLETSRWDGLEKIQPKLEDALSCLTKLTQEAHTDLSKIEIDVLTHKTTESLTALGYQVKRKVNKGGVLMRGIKKDLSIAAHVTSEGELHIDLAGFEGASCKWELERLNEELKKRGIQLEIRSSLYHGKKGGGVLAQEAEQNLPRDINPPQAVKHQKSNRRHHLNNLRRMRQCIH